MTGKRLKGRLGGGAGYTVRTDDLMAEAGCLYHTSWIIDDQPWPINVRGGQKFIFVPYTGQTNDAGMLAWNREADHFQQMIKDQFDTLYREGAETGGSCASPCTRTISAGRTRPNILTRRCATSSGTTGSGPRQPTTSPILSRQPLRPGDFLDRRTQGESRRLTGAAVDSERERSDANAAIGEATAMAWHAKQCEDNMAQQNRFDPARLERIERRLQVLEDAEAIRNLKARYAALCDNRYDAEGIASLFTEDAVWESPGLGRFEGREAIRVSSGERRASSALRSITV